LVVVKALGWQSFDRQFEPHLCAFMALRRSSHSGVAALAWDAVPDPMIEYIDPELS
jgi:hypothetical protein